MLGERLALNHVLLNSEPSWIVPASFGPLSTTEAAACRVLGDEDFRYWVGRGWLAVFAD